jgi:enoyl-CoA hydratase/carnithine racemase
MSEPLRSERHANVLHLVLNRPEKRNALNLGLCHQLVSALDHADADRQVHAVVISSNGPAFCAGMDLNEALSPPAELGQVHEQLFAFGSRLSKPVIAAVEGAALGGGMGVVANAHIVVAAEGATFGLTEIRIALWPFLIFRSVAQAVGERRAVELSLTGRIFDAAEARELGFVHHVTPQSETLDKAMEIAETVAAYSAPAIRGGLTFVKEIRGRSLAEAGHIGRQIREQVFRTPEFRQSVEGFLRKG